MKCLDARVGAKGPQRITHHAPTKLRRLGTKRGLAVFIVFIYLDRHATRADPKQRTKAVVVT